VPAEPPIKRTIFFVDGQNLYHSVRESFGYTYPNYDVKSLPRSLCQKRGWNLIQTRFYTGVPDQSDDSFWNYFWTHKLAMLGRQGVVVYSRSLRYRNRPVKLPDGTDYSFLAAEEKGIDVRIAIDIIRMAHHNEYDVALILSQDQDLSEVDSEIRTIAHEQNRWIKVACAFPLSPTTRNRRGIEKTDWVPIERATYDSCIDRRDYRVKDSGKGEEKP
jgi:uncharacterized LabA/DUF88 family protein